MGGVIGRRSRKLDLSIAFLLAHPTLAFLLVCTYAIKGLVVPLLAVYDQWIVFVLSSHTVLMLASWVVIILTALLNVGFVLPPPLQIFIVLKFRLVTFVLLSHYGKDWLSIALDSFFIEVDLGLSIYWVFLLEIILRVLLGIPLAHKFLFREVLNFRFSFSPKISLLTDNQHALLFFFRKQLLLRPVGTNNVFIV